MKKPEVYNATFHIERAENGVVVSVTKNHSIRDGARCEERYVFHCIDNLLGFLRANTEDMLPE